LGEEAERITAYGIPDERPGGELAQPLLFVPCPEPCRRTAEAVIGKNASMFLSAAPAGSVTRAVTGRTLTTEDGRRHPDPRGNAARREGDVLPGSIQLLLGRVTSY